MTSLETAARISRSRKTSDRARNEKQKAFLLEHVAKRLNSTAAKLCATSRRLVSGSIARAQLRRRA